jgi:Zn-dependent protease with chaperone function
MDFALEILATASRWLVHAWVAPITGISLCLFAAHLVLAQGRSRPNRAGTTPVGAALMMAVPIFLVGFAILTWWVSR